MSTWVFGAERWENLIYYSLGGHKDVIVGCFFEKDSLDVSFLSERMSVSMVASGYVTAMSVCLQLYTVSQDGTLCVWESDTEPDGLVLKKTPATTQRQEVDGDEEGEERREGEEGEVIRGKAEAPKEKKTKNVRYKQASKYEVFAVDAKFSLFQVFFPLSSL